jgi:hypothetical protein
MLDTNEVATRVGETKALLRRQLPNAASVFAEVSDALSREAAEIAARRADGEAVVPVVPFSAVAAGTVPDATRQEILRRGCVVVQGVFSADQARAWDAELMDYVRRNDYEAHAKEKMGLDRYFARMKNGRPQIYGIYWSRPQVAARQGENLATTRAWLNHLWSAHGAFDPDRECTYADRIRQREPGDGTLGLSPHMDGGSVERWIDPAFRAVYRHVFAGAGQAHDAWDAAHRTEVQEIPSAAVCRIFRTFQGWTALTPQGPGGGTLQVVPMTRAIIYMLLRPLLDDVAETELCGAEAGRALWMQERWHAPLMQALIPIPHVAPGDTVWWHPDLVHGVEDRNGSTGYASVIYIGAAPDCPKNRAFLALQKAAFLSGKSSPDFAPEDYEVDFAGRATEADLTPLGRMQMGFGA